VQRSRGFDAEAPFVVACSVHFRWPTNVQRTIVPMRATVIDGFGLPSMLVQQDLPDRSCKSPTGPRALGQRRLLVARPR
jgi:hypothetical protein